MSQDELVLRAQAGDHDAFGALAGLVVGRMRGTARLILGDAGLADDAVQDALVAAWQNLPQLRDPARLDAWLHRLLVRACHRSARRDRRRHLIEIPLLADHEPSTADSSGPLAVRDELARAFGKLTSEQRTLLSLVYYADLRMEDVASALGVPLGTARSRFYRAMDALRGVLAADERRPVVLQEGMR